MAGRWYARGFTIAEKFGATALTLYGLYSLLRDLGRATDSVAITAGLVLVLCFGIIAPFVYHLFPPLTLREIRVGRFGAAHIYTNYHKEVLVRQDLRAVVRTTRSIVFLEAPHQEDLIDAYSIGDDWDIDTFQYRSADAYEVGRKRASNNRLTIFWQPHNGVVKEHVVYTHSDEWTPPFSYVYPALFTEFVCVNDTGIFATTVHTPFRIEHAILFVRPRFSRLSSDEKLVPYALKVKEGAAADNDPLFARRLLYSSCTAIPLPTPVHSAARTAH